MNQKNVDARSLRSLKIGDPVIVYGINDKPGLTFGKVVRKGRTRLTVETILGEYRVSLETGKPISGYSWPSVQTVTAARHKESLESKRAILEALLKDRVDEAFHVLEEAGVVAPLGELKVDVLVRDCK